MNKSYIYALCATAAISMVLTGCGDKTKDSEQEPTTSTLETVMEPEETEPSVDILKNASANELMSSFLKQMTENNFSLRTNVKMVVDSKKKDKTETVTTELVSYQHKNADNVIYISGDQKQFIDDQKPALSSYDMYFITDKNGQSHNFSISKGLHAESVSLGEKKQYKKDIVTSSKVNLNFLMCGEPLYDYIENALDKQYEIDNQAFSKEPSMKEIDGKSYYVVSAQLKKDFFNIIDPIDTFYRLLDNDLDNPIPTEFYFDPYSGDCIGYQADLSQVCGLSKDYAKATVDPKEFLVNVYYEEPQSFEIPESLVAEVVDHDSKIAILPSESHSEVKIQSSFDLRENPLYGYVDVYDGETRIGSIATTYKNYRSYADLRDSDQIITRNKINDSTEMIKFSLDDHNGYVSFIWDETNKIGIVVGDMDKENVSKIVNDLKFEINTIAAETETEKDENAFVSSHIDLNKLLCDAIDNINQADGISYNIKSKIYMQIYKDKEEKTLPITFDSDIDVFMNKNDLLHTYSETTLNDKTTQADHYRKNTNTGSIAYSQIYGDTWKKSKSNIKITQALFSPSFISLIKDVNNRQQYFDKEVQIDGKPYGSYEIGVPAHMIQPFLDVIENFGLKDNSHAVIPSYKVKMLVDAETKSFKSITIDISPLATSLFENVLGERKAKLLGKTVTAAEAKITIDELKEQLIIIPRDAFMGDDE